MRDPTWIRPSSRASYTTPEAASPASPCDQCGFVPPIRADLPTEIRALPSLWAAALRSGRSATIEDAARLRDELHAVANRVARLLVASGSTVSPVRIGTPTELARPPSIDLLVELIRIEANRLAEISESAGAEWGWIGRVGVGPVAVTELAAVPLHSSHRMLAREPSRDANVIFIAQQRHRAGRTSCAARRTDSLARG